jgi:hypothetical protein
MSLVFTWKCRFVQLRCFKSVLAAPQILRGRITSRANGSV